MAELFWLSEAQMARLRPFLPNKPRGMPRVDDRRVISGILQVLISGGCWVDAPAAYRPRKTLYNRWIRWARKGVWRRAFIELATAGGPAAERMLDSTHAKAHRCAAGGPGGCSSGHRALARRPHHEAARAGRRTRAAGGAGDHGGPARRRADGHRPA